jgi:hypothetical protein
VPGQERIFLAHRLVAHDGDLTVAGCSDEGDAPATLEEAEDALARTLDDPLDILLRWGGRRMEHLALVVSV